MLSGVEEKTKQTCPAKGNVSMGNLNVRGVFLPGSVRLPVAAGTLLAVGSKLTLLLQPSRGKKNRVGVAGGRGAEADEWGGPRDGFARGLACFGADFSFRSAPQGLLVVGEGAPAADGSVWRAWPPPGQLPRGRAWCSAALASSPGCCPDARFVYRLAFCDAVKLHARNWGLPF